MSMNCSGRCMQHRQFNPKCAAASHSALLRGRRATAARTAVAPAAASPPAAAATATVLIDPSAAPAVPDFPPSAVIQVPSRPNYIPAGLESVDFFAPPSVEYPSDELLAAGVPFLARGQAAGALPAVPASLDHALYRYSDYASKYVSVRVDNEHVALRSWGDAVAALRRAHAEGRPYWCSLLEAVQHPAWWPEDGHVPNYDQVIFGRGGASIGNHFDKDNACAGGSRRPVGTYLAIAAGAKLVLLLPPGQQLAPPGGDARALLEPSAALLGAARAAGGHYFILEPSASSSSGSGGEDAVALYMPPGWWHWVVGLTDWHVVYGGSHYAEAPLRRGRGG